MGVVRGRGAYTSHTYRVRHDHGRCTIARLFSTFFLPPFSLLHILQFPPHYPPPPSHLSTLPRGIVAHLDYRLSDKHYPTPSACSLPQPPPTTPTNWLSVFSRFQSAGWQVGNATFKMQLFRRVFILLLLHTTPMYIPPPPPPGGGHRCIPYSAS